MNEETRQLLSKKTPLQLKDMVFNLADIHQKQPKGSVEYALLGITIRLLIKEACNRVGGVEFAKMMAGER